MPLFFYLNNFIQMKTQINDLEKKINDLIARVNDTDGTLRENATNET